MSDDQQHPYGGYGDPRRSESDGYDRYGSPQQTPPPHDSYRDPAGAGTGGDPGLPHGYPAADGHPSVNGPSVNGQNGLSANGQPSSNGLPGGHSSASGHAYPDSGLYPPPAGPLTGNRHRAPDQGAGGPQGSGWSGGPEGRERPPAPPASGDQDSGMTQIWDAPTWDTQHQPHTTPGAQWRTPQPQTEAPYQPPGPYQPQTAGQPPYAPDPYQPSPSPLPPLQEQSQTAGQPSWAAQPLPPVSQQGVVAGDGYAAGNGYPPPQASYPLPPEVQSPVQGAFPAESAPMPQTPPGPASAVPPPAMLASHPRPGTTQTVATPTVTTRNGSGPDTPSLDSAGYSAPTLVGNTRITDAQRARAEGRSPIIAPGMQQAALTAVLGLLLAGGAALGSYALLVPLVLLQALTAAGWFRLNGMWPARQGIALAFAGGLVSDVVLLAVGRDHAPAAITGTIGVWVLLTLVLQLRSHAGPDERMQGLMATLSSAALTILATGYPAALSDAVIVGALAVAAAVVVRPLPLPGSASVVLALLAAAGVGGVASGFTDLGPKGALLGLTAGCCALIGLRVASYDYPSRFVHMTAGVALPLTAAAPAVYLLGLVLT